jgi:hypothetical protein
MCVAVAAFGVWYPRWRARVRHHQAARIASICARLREMGADPHHVAIWEAHALECIAGMAPLPPLPPVRP